jgi:hypothetical protein
MYLAHYRAREEAHIYRYAEVNALPVSSVVLEGEVFPAPGNIKAALEGNYGSLEKGAKLNQLSGKYELVGDPAAPAAKEEA